MLLSPDHTDLKPEELSIKNRPCSHRQQLTPARMCVPGGAERAVQGLRTSKKNQLTGDWERKWSQTYTKRKDQGKITELVVVSGRPCLDMVCETGILALRRLRREKHQAQNQPGLYTKTVSEQNITAVVPTDGILEVNYPPDSEEEPLWGHRCDRRSLEFCKFFCKVKEDKSHVTLYYNGWFDVSGTAGIGEMVRARP